LGVFFLKPINPPGSIYKSLLSSVKGVAIGAYLNINVFSASGLSLYLKPAGTFNHSRVFFGMNLFFHGKTSIEPDQGIK
jgi:hypothetical protein